MTERKTVQAPGADAPMGQWARFYAALGMKVLPLEPRGKKPLGSLVPHGVHDATGNPDTIEFWWRKCPDANIGIATGGGLFVLDVDDHPDDDRNGPGSLRLLQQRFGALPPTWRVRTGSGGAHYYYQVPARAGIGCGANRLGVGLDHRCEGGYVAAPPSVHPCGERYRWDPSSNMGIAPAKLPEWVLRLLLGPSPEERCAAIVGEVRAAAMAPEEIPKGQRNDTLFRLACSLRKKGLEQAEIMAALRVTNSARCRPPMTEEELAACVAGACRYAPGEIPKGGFQKMAKDRPRGESAGDVIPEETAADAAEDVILPLREETLALLSARMDAMDGLRPRGLTDLDTADLLAGIARGLLVWTEGLGWLAWDGRRWEETPEAGLAAAQFFARRMRADAAKRYREALAGGEAARGAAAEAKKYYDHALRLMAKSRLASIAELLRVDLLKKMTETQPDGSILPTFDADPALLNTPAGVVDLPTGKISPHDPALNMTHMTAVAPGEKGKVLWSCFLEDVTGGDAETEDYLRQIAGMALFGRVYEEGITIAYGDGGTGKSTFFNVLRAVMGDYAGGIDVEVLLSGRDTAAKSELDVLRGRRLIVAGELEEGVRLSASSLKRITSTDTIHACRKYGHPYDFIPSHTLLMYSNHLPRVGSNDRGTWRRIRVVPFGHQVAADKIVRNYEQVLLEECGEAILAWAVEGAAAYAANGYSLKIPPAVRAATEAYETREDWVPAFIDEVCEVGEGFSCRAGDLYKAYLLWCQSSGTFKRQRSEFNDALMHKGYQKDTHGHHKSYWTGLKLSGEVTNSMIEADTRKRNLISSMV